MLTTPSAPSVARMGSRSNLIMGCEGMINCSVSSNSFPRALRPEPETDIHVADEFADARHCSDLLPVEMAWTFILSGKETNFRFNSFRARNLLVLPLKCYLMLT
jgi:hypothetical protein